VKTKRFFAVVVAAMTCVAGLMAPAAAEFKVGAALRVVTPDPLLPVSGGVGIPTPSKEQKGDLFARTVVFEQGDTRVALVSVDFLGWSQVLGDKSRALITGVAPENVLIGSTHTHSAPDPYAFPDGKGGHTADLEYLDWVCEQIAESVNEAVSNLEPARIKVAMDKIAEGIAYNYYAPNLYDRRCNVMQALKKDSDEVIMTFVNYAIHPEVLGSAQGILSPDMCGPLYDRLEEKAGGMAFFMNGALGGMITADNRNPDTGRSERTWEQCVRIGELLADEALRIVADAPIQENPAVTAASRVVNYPVDSPLMRQILKLSPLGYEISEEGTIPSRLALVNVGSAQMLTIPGEALPNIGFYLKRNMPSKHPFLLGLTNDAFGYILTIEDFNSFERYDYISRTSLGEQTGPVYIENALALIEEGPKPEAP